MKKIIDADFRLKKDYGCYKKGHIFNSYGGLCSGVQDITFLDKEWFEPLNIKTIDKPTIQYHRTMIRKSLIVKKEEVFDFLKDPLVSKIEIKRDGNNHLKDDTIVRVHVYMNSNKELFRNFKWNLIGIVKKKNEENSWVSQENRDYLTGLVSAKFLKETCIERLKLIEIEEGINLAIPHALDN